MSFILDGRVVTVLTPDGRANAAWKGAEQQNALWKRQQRDKTSANSSWPRSNINPIKFGNVKHTNSGVLLSGGAATVVDFARSRAAFVLSLHSLMIALSLPLPPLPPSHFLFPPPTPPRVLLSFVWLLILVKRTDQIFLLQCTRLSAGAWEIWWLGLTDGRGPWVWSL